MRQTTATIKFGSGHRSPWLVLAGTPAEIRAQILEAFQLDATEVGHYTLDQLISLASKQAQASANTITGLEATVMAEWPTVAEQAKAHAATLPEAEPRDE